MTTFSRLVVSLTAGDVNDQFTVRAVGVDDLDWVDTVECHVWRPGQEPVTLTATVTDPAECQVTVDCGDAEGWLATAEPSVRYLGELELAGSGQVLTWPSERAWLLRIHVRAQGD